MQNPLSYIIGVWPAWRRKWNAAAERRKLLQQLVIQEERELNIKRAHIEEQKQLADAWMPFKTKRLTKGQAKSLTFFDDISIEALEVIEEEIRAELSNRAMRNDGVVRDRAMWAAVGIRMYMDTLKQKIEHFKKQNIRKDVEKKIEAERSEKTVSRTMRDLYGERLITTQ